MKHKFLSVLSAIIISGVITSCGTDTAAPAIADTAIAVPEAENENSAETSAEESVSESISETVSETETADTETTQTETAEETASAETVTEADTTEETSAEPAEEKIKLPIHHTENLKNDTIMSDDGEALLFRGSYRYIVIDNPEDFPELSKTDINKGEDLIRDYMQQRDELVSSAKEHYSYSPDAFTGEYPMTYYIDVDNTVLRSDEIIFSVLYGQEGYAGGAHGWNIHSGINYDASTGKELSLGDICTDIPRLTDILGEKLEKDYPDLSGVQNLGSGKDLLVSVYGEELQGGVNTFDDGTEYELYKINFVFTPDGVTFFSNSYDLGSYAEGPQQLTVLFSEAPGLFKEEYVRSGDDFSIYISDYFDICFDEDGNCEEITLDYDYDESSWSLKGFIIKGFGQEKYIEYTPDNYEDAYNLTKHIERTDGKYKYSLSTKSGKKIAEAEF